MVRALKEQLKEFAGKLMRPGLADVHRRLELIEVKVRRRAEEETACEAARRSKPSGWAVWRGGASGLAVRSDGSPDWEATAKQTDELAYWLRVARGEDPSFPGEFHAVFGEWQRTRLRELADQLELDAAGFAAWAERATVVEIGGGPHPAVSEMRWKRAVAVDPLADAYATERLYPEFGARAGGEENARLGEACHQGGVEETRLGEACHPGACSTAARVVHLAAVGESIPLAGGIADLVIIENALDHTDEPRAVTTEIARLLRPGGLVWLLVDLMEYKDHMHPNPMTEARLRETMRRAGLEEMYLASWDGASHPMAKQQCRSLWRKK